MKIVAEDGTACDGAEPVTKALPADEAAEDHLMRASTLRLISAIEQAGPDQGSEPTTVAASLGKQEPSIVQSKAPAAVEEAAAPEELPIVEIEALEHPYTVQEAAEPKEPSIFENKAPAHSVEVSVLGGPNLWVSLLHVAPCLLLGALAMFAPDILPGVLLMCALVMLVPNEN